MDVKIEIVFKGHILRMTPEERDELLGALQETKPADAVMPASPLIPNTTPWITIGNPVSPYPYYTDTAYNTRISGHVDPNANATFTDDLSNQIQSLCAT